MNHKVIFAGISIFIIFGFSSEAQHDKLPVLQGSYLGQKPPGKTPHIFAEGIVSTDKVELNAVFSKDHKFFYFTRKNDKGLYQIWEMKMEENVWSEPYIAPFSGIYEEADPFISYDGKYFFFCKNNDIYWVEAKIIEKLKPDELK